MSANTTPGIITVSYGSGEPLSEFLSTLFATHPNLPPQNVVVVDNKPDHENVEGVARQFQVGYVPLPANPGYGAGMNAGAHHLRSIGLNPDSFFFCNPDVAFIEPVLSHLSKQLQTDLTVGSIGPRLLNLDGSVYPSAREIPSLRTGIGHALFGQIWPNNPWSRAYKNAHDYERPRPAGSLSGAAVMTSAQAYDRIGGWDEAYFMHFEDIDLGWRLGQQGYGNLFDPRVSVTHTGAHSTKSHALLVEQAMTQSAIRFMSKRYAGFWNTPLRVGIVLGLRARGALRVRRIRSEAQDAS